MPFFYNPYGSGTSKGANFTLYEYDVQWAKGLVHGKDCSQVWGWGSAITAASGKLSWQPGLELQRLSASHPKFTPELSLWESFVASF
jgi:hypothetical protein